MKNKYSTFAVILMMIINVSACKSQCDNEKARNYFSQKITLLKNSLENNDQNLKDIPATIQELETITSIKSKADGNFLGKFKPLKADIDEWETWYKNNGNKLCWDDNQNGIYLIK